MEMESTILQASHNFRTQIVGDIFSISEDLWNIVQSDMENQAYHIQALLADKLYSCKGKKTNTLKHISRKFKRYINKTTLY